MSDPGPEQLDELVLELCRSRRPRDPRFAEPTYLDWLYHRNPEGPAVRAEVLRDGRALAHVAAVPQRWWTGDAVERVGLLVNFMAAGDGRSLGHLPELVRRLRAAGSETDAVGVLAVTNATSTAIAKRILHAEHLGALPVVIGRAGAGAGVRSGDPEDLDALLERWRPPAGWYQAWTPELLAWRLARPDAAYRLHLAGDAAALSTTTRVLGVRFTVVLKLLRLDDGGGVRDADDLVGAACRDHGTRAYVHAGHEPQFRVRGLRPPRRLLPSPLHLLHLSLGDGPTPPPRQPPSIAFLDVDAY